MDPATDQKTVTDEQVEQQLSELSQKAERTDEDNQKIEELKTERQSRYQQRIDKIKSEEKYAAHRAEEAEKRAKELEERLAKIESRPDEEPVSLREDTVEISGKKYYTDEALQSMIENKKMTASEANSYAYNRDKAQMRTEILSEVKGETQKSDVERKRQEDIDKVFKKYPHFSKFVVSETGEKALNPKFNPDDPLYKEANRLFLNGYHVQPDGLSKAITDAKKILGIKDSQPSTDNVTFHPPGGAEHRREEDGVFLSQDEKDVAVKQFRDVMNPVTRRPYTEKEILEKALRAKKKRAELRRQ